MRNGSPCSINVTPETANRIRASFAALYATEESRELMRRVAMVTHEIAAIATRTFVTAWRLPHRNVVADVAEGLIAQGLRLTLERNSTCSYNAICRRLSESLSCAAETLGIVKKKVLPLPAVLSTQIRPP